MSRLSPTSREYEVRTGHLSRQIAKRKDQIAALRRAPIARKNRRNQIRYHEEQIAILEGQIRDRRRKTDDALAGLLGHRRLRRW